MVDVYILDLNRRRLALCQGVGVLIRLWNVVARLFQVVRIREVDDSHSRIEVGHPGELILEPVDLAVDCFGMFPVSIFRVRLGRHHQ